MMTTAITGVHPEAVAAVVLFMGIERLPSVKPVDNSPVAVSICH
jgi:hypothetical protein